MAKDYLRVAPVEQFDPTSCWAAALQWWARAIGGRVVVRQLDLLNIYVRYWDSRDPDNNPNYGTISRAGLISVIEDSRWGMSASPMPGGELTNALLNQKMRLGPVILGYYDSVVSGGATPNCLSDRPPPLPLIPRPHRHH